MDKKLEQQLRKACFYTLAGQWERITGRSHLTLSEVKSILKVSRPTAKKFMESLIDAGKAKGHRGKRGELLITVYYYAYTVKEVDSSESVYDSLAWELSQEAWGWKS